MVALLLLSHIIGTGLDFAVRSLSSIAVLTCSSRICAGLDTIVAHLFTASEWTMPGQQNPADVDGHSEASICGHPAWASLQPSSSSPWPASRPLMRHRLCDADGKEE